MLNLSEVRPGMKVRIFSLGRPQGPLRSAFAEFEGVVLKKGPHGSYIDLEKDGFTETVYFGSNNVYQIESIHEEREP